MPRNGSGTYSVPNSFTSGTTISSSSMNANFSDVGSEITASLPRNGEAAMTGQLKAASGTVSAPGITFGSDLDTGLYLKSANTIGVVAGGTEVGTIGTTGISSFPTGTVMLFVQTDAPTGWTKSTTHNNKALRVVSGTASSGGSTAFTSVFTSRTIAQANLPNVSLVSSSLSASTTTTVTNALNYYMGTSLSSFSGGGANSTPTNGATALGLTATSTTTISGTVPLGGSGTAMDFAVQYVDVIIATKD